MLLTKVPQPLQQPMLLYKPLASFVALYIQKNLNRSCQRYRTFWSLYYISFEIVFRYLKWVFRGISFCFLVCQIWSFEVANVYTYFGCAYNKLWKNSTDSIESFRGLTIAHLKYIFVISNSYFAEFDFDLWFERYDQLKQPISVKQCTRVSWDSTNILSLSGPPQRNYVIWMEMSLRYLKWVFDGIQFHHLQQKLWIDLWKDINFPQFSNLGILLNHIVLLFFPMYNTLYQQQVVIANTVMGQPHKTLLFFGNWHIVIMGLFLAWVKWWGPSFSKGGGMIQIQMHKS